jgi:hypothetical protein
VSGADEHLSKRVRNISDRVVGVNPVSPTSRLTHLTAVIGSLLASQKATIWGYAPAGSPWCNALLAVRAKAPEKRLSESRYSVLLQGI